MGDRCMKGRENPYFAARKESAKYRPELNSRAEAAARLGCSESSLSDYELGVTKTMPPDMVVKMADLYNCPKLKTMYCMYSCPIGRDMPLSCEDKTLEQVAVSLACKLNPRTVEGVQETILRICEDGIIDENERGALGDIMETLDSLTKAIGELRTIAEKIEGGGNND